MHFTKVLYLAISVIPLTVFAKAGDVIPNSYIVVLKDSVSDAEFQSHRLWAVDSHSAALAKRGDLGTRGLKHTYNLGKLKGYSGSFDKETIAQIASRPEVRIAVYNYSCSC